jgi:hypothetical protein
MAYPTELGMELPKAGAQGTTTKGGRNRELEAASLAAYKKTLKGLVPTWYSRMKADLCSLPMSDEPGRPKEKPLMYTIGSNKTKYRLLERSRFRPYIKGYNSLSASDPGIFPADMLFNFSRTCLNIYEAIFFFFGMEVPFIKAKWLPSSLKNILAFVPKDSLLTPQSLIRWSTSGVRQMLHYLTEPLPISPNCRLNYISILAEYDHQNNYSGRVFMQAD